MWCAFVSSNAYPYTPSPRVNITYVDRDGQRLEIQGKVGDNALYLAHRHNIEMEGLNYIVVCSGFAKSIFPPNFPQNYNCRVPSLDNWEW